MNALFYDYSQNDYYPKKSQKNIHINTSPLNKNGLHKNTSCKLYNYLLDNTDNLELSSTSKHNKKSNGKKNKKKNNRTNGKNSKKYFINTLSDSESSIRKEKKKRNNGAKIKKFNISRDYYDNQDSNDSYENIMNSYSKLNVNCSTSLKKKKNHKRTKSCLDPSKIDLKQGIDKNENEGFYKLENKSHIFLNKTKNKKKSKLEIYNTENKSRKYKNVLIKNILPKRTKESMKSLANSYIKNKTKNNKSYNNYLNSSSDVSFRTNYNVSLEDLKNKLKDKLISVTRELQFELKAYDGPINIDCISLKNTDESMNDMMNKMIINGYDCIRNKDNVIKCNKGKKFVDIELVKIRGNLLYFLIKKS